jgi:hypothetical protein
MPLKRNLRDVMEPEAYTPAVDEKKEAKQRAREAFLERKMGSPASLRRYDKARAIRKRPSPEHHDD